MVMSYEPLEVGCVVKARVIGALIVEDEAGEDAKMLSVPVNDARFDGYHDMTDVHPHKIKEIQEFFETHKRLESHKWVRFKEWRNAESASKIVTYSMDKYKELIKQKKWTGFLACSWLGQHLRESFVFLVREPAFSPKLPQSALNLFTGIVGFQHVSLSACFVYFSLKHRVLLH